MIATTAVRDTVAALRAHRELIAGRNGLQPAVVESWLAAAEARCSEGSLDETGVRVCLRVIERWISPLGELAGVHSSLVRILATGKLPLGMFGLSPSLKEWLPLPAAGGGDHFAPAS
jgi:hypothetical protein